MKRLVIAVIIVLINLTLTQCISKNATSRRDSDVISEVKRNYTQVQLDQGKSIWQKSCNQCHDLYAPETMTLKKWKHILPEMVGKANLSDTDGKLVEAYIIANLKPRS
jgi:cytochrome c5